MSEVQSETRADKRRRNRPAVIDENQFYSVGEYAAFTDQSEARARDEVKQGGVRSVPRGPHGRIRILGAWIIERNRKLAGLTS